jgi:hypothetical protein
MTEKEEQIRDGQDAQMVLINTMENGKLLEQERKESKNG